MSKLADAVSNMLATVADVNEVLRLSDDYAELADMLDEAAQHLDVGRDEGDLWLTCPNCGSDRIEGHHLEVDAYAAWQPVECHNCGADWNEVYLPAHRDNINVPS